MRVTRIPGDFYDIGDKPCRIYLNGAEIAEWIVADDFRRVVETPAGARFGSVRIDLSCAEPVAAPDVPVTSLSGIFVAEPKPEAPAIEIIEAHKAEPIAPAAPVKALAKPARRKRGR